MMSRLAPAAILTVGLAIAARAQNLNYILDVGPEGTDEQVADNAVEMVLIADGA